LKGREMAKKTKKAVTKRKSVSMEDHDEAIAVLAKFNKISVDEMKKRFRRISDEAMAEVLAMDKQDKEPVWEWHFTPHWTASVVADFLNRNRREIGPNDFQIVRHHGFFFIVFYFYPCELK
jgi:hypothetical protein